MRNFKETSDLLSELFYESIERTDEGYKKATDLVRVPHNPGRWWSPSVEEEVKHWYNRERERIILNAGFSIREYEVLADQESDRYLQECVKRDAEYQRSLEGGEPLQFIHMDDDTEPEDLE